jgi:hypothetical protein
VKERREKERKLHTENLEEKKIKKFVLENNKPYFLR